MNSMKEHKWYCIYVIYQLGGPYREVLKMLPEACGLGQQFQARGHGFSRYGPTQSW